MKKKNPDHDDKSIINSQSADLWERGYASSRIQPVKFLRDPANREGITPRQTGVELTYFPSKLAGRHNKHIKTI